MSVERLERATLQAWPAARRETRFGWEFCATSRCSGRVNAVWPLAWTDEVTIAQAIDEAIAWCSAHGITACFKLADGAVAPPELAAVLDARGFSPRTETLVMTLALAGQARGAKGRAELLDTPDETIWTPMRESAPSLEDFAERQAIVARIGAPRVFAHASIEGRPAAIGMGVFSDDLLGLFLMRTAPDARRRGLARDIVGALLDWGVERGASRAYLQVERSNAGAVALYESAGFETAYRYWYWTRGSG